MPGPSVTVVESGGLAVTPVESGAPEINLVDSGGIAVTIVESGGLPFIVTGYEPSPQPEEPTTPGFDMWETLNIAMESDLEEYPIVLSAMFPPESLATDYVRLQVRTLPALGEVLNVRIPIGIGNQSFPGLSDIMAGAHTIRERIERGIYYGDWSNSVEHGPDVIEPVLSAPTSAATGTTSASIGVTTDTAEGVLYYVLTTSATPPSKAQVKAGQNNGGTSAAWSGSQAVSSTGAKTAAPTGLSSATTYYTYFMHEDATGNQSTVSAAISFATDAASPVTLHASHAFDTQSKGFDGTPATFTGGVIGTAQTNRICVACVVAYDGGANEPASVTIGGVSATKISSSGHMSMWRASVPTGTTADVVVTAPGGGGWGWAGCLLASIRTGSPTPTGTTTTTWEWAAGGPASSVTTPTDGLTLAFAARDSTGATAAWSNATAQGFKANLIWSAGIATRAIAGTATITAGGFGGATNALLTASWGP